MLQKRTVLLTLCLFIAVISNLALGQPSNLKASPLTQPPILTNIRQISAGKAHTCALTDTGGVKCWGYNYNGGLGDGSSLQRNQPVDVIGLDSGVLAVSVGDYHTCALTSQHTVKCWGYGIYGQLGDGSTVDRYIPVDVVGLSNVIAIAAGAGNSCALIEGGTVKCWGSNIYGALGDGTHDSKPTPVNVLGLNTGVQSISAGWHYYCALIDNQTVRSGKCWGANFYGELGDGTSVEKTSPVDVIGLTTSVLTITAGTWHSCAVLSTNNVKCWGRNDAGELGNGTATQSTVPVDVNGLSNPVTEIEAGEQLTCALTGSGSVQCWGANNAGQVGDGTNLMRTLPVQVSGMDNGVIDIATGAFHACALLADHTVKCWGDNSYGQLGDGTNDNRNFPAQVVAVPPTLPNLREVIAVPFNAGLVGTTSVNAYTGTITIQVEGMGISSGTRFNDAFYIFTDSNGNPVTPFNPDPQGIAGSTLWIDGHSAFFTVSPTPTYQPSHIYSFTWQANGSPINFANGDGIVSDNSGSYRVTISQEDPPTPTPTATPSLTPTPIDTTPPPVPDGTSLTCYYYGTTTGGVNTYFVNYQWKSVEDIGTAGMHEFAYWSQLSALSDFSVVNPSEWYNSWDSALSRTSELTFAEGTILYAHVRSRDAQDNQSAWSTTDTLTLDGSTCSDTPPTPTHTPTATYTPTPSSTWTSTPSFTPTNTRTNTSTPTYTQTATQTSTRTPTPTSTRTATRTLTPTTASTATTSPTANPQITPPTTRRLTCTYETSTRFGQVYRVKYAWNPVQDTGEGIHPQPYLSQITQVGDYSDSAALGWSSAWNANNSQESGDYYIQSGTTYTARVKVRAVNGNESGWSQEDHITVSRSTCQPTEVVLLIPGIAGSELALNAPSLPDGVTNIWPFGLDKSLLTLRSDLARSNIYPRDLIRGVGIDPLTYPVAYGSIINRFQNEGYTWYNDHYNPGLRTYDGCDKTQTAANFFTFPWDWRHGVVKVHNYQAQGIAEPPKGNAELLGDFIGCIRKIHPDSQINIVAHSMGGLLARKYILDHKDAHHVKRLITIGTPWLGAPKAIVMMLNGDFMPCMDEKWPEKWPDYNVACIRTTTTRSLLEYFPGAHQLLPSWQYFDLVQYPYRYPYIVQSPDNSLHFVPYDAFNAQLLNAYHSPDSTSYSYQNQSHVTFMTNNNSLFGDEKLSNWNEDDTGVQYSVLYGETSVAKTIAQVQEMSIYRLDMGDIITSYVPLYALGDDTVPLVSSRRQENGKDLNGKVKPYRFTDKSGQSVSHTKLPSNPVVQDCVFKLIEGIDCGATSNQVHSAGVNSEASEPARYLYLWGINSIQLTDGVSTTSNLITDTRSLTALFPEIQLDHMEPDGVVLIIPSSAVYTVSFTTNGYFELDSHYGVGEASEHTVRYTGIPVVTGTQMALSTDITNVAALEVDTNQDGAVDQLVAPTGDVIGQGANDTTAPTVTVQFIEDSRTVEITPSDESSGIDRILYSWNGQTYFLYSGAFVVEPTREGTLYAQSQDKVGNWSSVVSLNIHAAPTERKVYLPLVKR